MSTRQHPLQAWQMWHSVVGAYLILVAVHWSSVLTWFLQQSPAEGGGGGGDTATKPADLATLAEQRQRIAAQLAELEAQEKALRDQVPLSSRVQDRTNFKRV